jgi:hypothetical protein
MRKFAILAALVTAFVTALSISPAASAAPATEGVATATGLSTPFEGTVGGLPVTGTATVDRFVNQNGQLGALVDVVYSIAGGPQQTLGDIFVPITGAQAGGTCQILDLTLGPLHLDLLGLIVDLDTVHLEITAQQGPGNLLGNLLCGIAGALDGGGGGGLANLLNRLLGL